MVGPQLVASILRILQVTAIATAIKPRACTSSGIAVHLLDQQAPALEPGLGPFLCSHLTQWSNLVGQDPVQQTSRPVRDPPDPSGTEGVRPPEVGQHQGHRVEVPLDGENCIINKS